MAEPSVHCPKCRALLPADPAAAAALERCPSCRTRLRLVVFPALTATAQSVSTPSPIVSEGEAACFYHSAKQAVVPCDQCGRFLCALCDLEVAGRHLCPSCLETGAKAGQVAGLERSRTRHDLIAWYLLLLPLLSIGFALPITAPIALVWALLKRNTKPSLVDRSRRWLNWAIPVALVEFVGGVAVWVAAFQSNS
jgi:uncharacterized paraquat-inducible protein A